MSKPVIVLDPGHGGLTSFFYDLDNGVRLSNTWAEVRRLDASDKTYFDASDLRRWRSGELSVEPRFYFERNGRRITWGDPGAVSPLEPRICEKDLALDVSRSIRSEIGRALQVKATRDRDGYVAVESRVRHARQLMEKHQAPILFLSLHAEASKDAEERGLRLYAAPGTGEDVLEGFETELARYAGEAPGEPPLGVELRESEPLGGLEMPWLTLVMGFLSNTEDAQRLLARPSRQALASSLTRAAVRYLAGTGTGAGRDGEPQLRSLVTVGRAG